MYKPNKHYYLLTCVLRIGLLYIAKSCVVLTQEHVSKSRARHCVQTLVTYYLTIHISLINLLYFSPLTWQVVGGTEGQQQQQDPAIFFCLWHSSGAHWPEAWSIHRCCSSSFSWVFLAFFSCQAFLARWSWLGYRGEWCDQRNLAYVS